MSEVRVMRCTTCETADTKEKCPCILVITVAVGGYLPRISCPLRLKNDEWEDITNEVFEIPKG